MAPVASIKQTVNILDYMPGAVSMRNMHQSRKSESHVSLAMLLREARTTHVLAIRKHLASSSFKDMPRDGVFAMAAIRDLDLGAGELGRKMGLSKQAVSQLLDTLVMRGYVERSADAVDRRRVKLKLTARGAKASSLCRAVVDRIEQQLVQRVGARYVQHTRDTLAVLVELAADVESATPLSVAP